jgi:hypothetical protein
MDNPMGHVLCAGTQMEHGYKLGARIDGQPEPQHVFIAAQSGAQFVQLDVWEPEMTEGAFVQRLSMFTSASEPRGDSGLTVAEDTFGSRGVQPFGQRGEHHCDQLGRGFQTVEGRVAPGGERGTTGLTTKGLDALNMAMLAISDEGVDLSIGDPEVRALRVGTGVAFGVYPLGCSPAAFHLAPGANRCKCRPHTRRVGAGEATGGAVIWGAWLKETLGS